MIFVWSSNGGPLQYVSLVFFLLQFLPRFLPDNNATTTTNIHYAFLAVTLGAAMIAYGIHRGGSFQRIRQAFRQEWNTLRQTFTAGGVAWKRSLYIFLAMTTVLVTMALVTSPSTQGAMLLIHVITLYLLVRTLMRSLAGDDVGSAAPGRGHEQQRIHEIVDLVLRLPMEEFVPQEELASCSVNQLQKMLRVRMLPGNNNNATRTNFVEKRDLIEAVQACRNYNDTCCICCETYQARDGLRVLPKCRHEFHVECLDHWAYTFAKKPRQRQPTCPLCNTTLA